MKKLIDWMTNDFGPKASKIAKNPWIASIQDTMIAIMPIILISSFITILSIVKEYIPSLPSFGFISDFSFGISSLFVAFLVPTFVLEKLKLNKYRRQAGAMGVAMFIMMSVPMINENYQFVLDFSRLGAGGMFVAIVAGLIVSLIMKFFTNRSFFGKNNTMPKFLSDSFDSMMPIIVIMALGFILISLLKIDLYAIINILLTPLTNSAQSLWGFTLIMFLMAFFYTFGLSPWLLTPIYYPIGVQAIALNAENVAKGLAPTLITTNEVFAGWIWLGGTGVTLMLSIFMLAAKSQKLRSLGKVSIVPSICNINEPLVFGAIVFNPLLMIPMWIVSIVVPVITYFGFSIGAVTIPHTVFGLWYLPIGIQTFLINSDFRGLILLAINLGVSGIIYYPFFKAYDNQCLVDEKSNDNSKKEN